MAQQRQLSKFRAAAAAGRWARIHKDHFDWWMFPIEDGSQPGYNVYAEDVAALLADEEWVGGFTEGIEMVALAWGWELGASRPVSDPAAAAGQAWQDWDIRLAKMIRSAWLFGQPEARQSLQVSQDSLTVYHRIAANRPPRHSHFTTISPPVHSAGAGPGRGARGWVAIRRHQP